METLDKQCELIENTKSSSSNITPVTKSVYTQTHQASRDIGTQIGAQEDSDFILSVIV